MLGRIGVVLAFWKLGRLVLRLLKDSRVPFLSKLIVPVAALYTFFPIDLAPDFLPVLGQVDDLTMLLLCSLFFVRLSPRDVVREHWDAIAGRPRSRREPPGSPGKTIDGNYEILD